MEKLYIRMLGEFSLQFGENKISDHSNRSKKVWLLLAYLICHKGRIIPRKELISLLWGDDPSSSNPENTLKLSGLFIQLIGEVEQAVRVSHIKASPGEIRYVDRAKKYIYEHISEPIAQNDIATFLDITPEYLCSIFKKCEGRSVIRFINETKLTRIKMLMENNQLSLRQASAQYGFSDPNYVSKLYKKYYNETITQAAKGSKK